MINPFVVRDTHYIVQFLFEGLVFGAVAEITLSGNATYYLQGKTGSNRLVHFISRTMAHNGTDVTVEQYENPTLTANGTILVTAKNSNRESAKTAEFTIYSNPPVPTSDGILVAKDRIFGATGGVGSNAVSAATLSITGIERILKKGEDYVLKFINNTTATTTLVLSLLWYESSN